MALRFKKYQGTGNDFVIIDNRSKEIVLTESKIQELCERKFGIGSDGLMEILPSDSCSFKMVFYNPDASLSFCGNGARCAVMFAHDAGFFEDSGTFEAIDGMHRASVDKDTVVLEMLDVDQVESIEEAKYIDTGAPHFVVPVADLAKLDLESAAQKWRYHERGGKVGVNVNFIELQGDKVGIRTFEKGVEKETLSCGTGITAAAIAAHQLGWVSEEVAVNALGGTLHVSLNHNTGKYSNIWLKGQAKKVFEGEV